MLVSGTAFARDVDFTISLDNANIVPGRQTRLNITFSNSPDIPPTDIPVINGLDFRYIGSSKKADSVTHVYSVAALGTGEFWLGPFTFSYNGNNYISNDLLLRVSRDSGTVTKKAEERELKVTPETGSDDILRHIYIEPIIQRESVYVGERVPVTANLYSDWLDVEQVQVWDTPNPNYVTEKYVTGETSIVTKSGIKYVLVEFKKDIIFPAPGDYEFGPILATCNVAKKTDKLLNNNSVFYENFIGRSNSKPLEIQTGLINFNVLPLPRKDQPTDFRGAVGNFSLKAGVDTNKIDLGAPIVLTTEISGSGNFNSINPPIVEKMDGITPYDPTGELQDDAVVFTQLFKISSPRIKELPTATFSYFDPETKQYKTLRKGPFPLTVVVPEGFKEKEPEPLEIKDRNTEKSKDLGLVNIKRDLGKTYSHLSVFHTSTLFFFFIIIPVLLLAVAITVQQRIHKIETDKDYAGWLKASKMAKNDIEKLRSLLRKDESEGYYTHVFKTLQNYIGNRLDIDPGGISIDTVDKVLVSRIENKEITSELKKVFRDCYDIRYTPSKKEGIDLGETFESVESIIDYLNNKRKI